MTQTLPNNFGQSLNLLTGAHEEVTIPRVVREQPLYRFDGTPGQRSFSADLVALAGMGDVDQREAERYLKPWLASHAAATFANVTTGNVSSLNPAPTVGYIDQAQRGVPLRSLVSPGMLDTVAGVVVPKFSAASGLAGDHTEGAEPSDGSFSTAQAAHVQPRPISGRVTVNREVVDQGGPVHADQAIWSAMQNAYNEVAEQRIAALLAGLSLTPVPLAGLGSELDSAFAGVWAPLQTTRGGAQMSSLALSPTLYGAFAQAVDDAGRRLYGLGGNRLVVGPYAGTPAWALGTGDGGDGNSYLFDPEAVVAFDSGPTRLTLDRVAVGSVVIGVWGYFAAACYRDEAVKRLTYSPS